jgi:hypothetical protein
MIGRIAATVTGVFMAIGAAGTGHGAPSPATDACPPFQLRAEDGSVINPLGGLNADVPYSPKQTCGECHDYDLIAEGYHFQQGKDERASRKLQRLYHWVSSPGDYGGRW